MDASNIVLSQGSFNNLRPTLRFLESKGVSAEIVCPPGKDPNG